MKTLSKLNINPEKIMKNDELIALRGGTEVPHCKPEDPGQYPCFCTCGGGSYFVGCLADESACKTYCKEFE